MLYVDSQLLDVNSNTKAAQEFKEAKKQILDQYKGRFPLSFKVKYKYRVDPVTKEILPGRVTWLRWHSMSDSLEDGSHSWEYSPVMGIKDDKGRLKFPSTGEVVSKSLKIDVDQIDKIFFLLYKSRAVKNGLVYLEDKIKEADDKQLSNELKAQVNYYIWVKDALSTTKLLIIARAYGIMDVEKMTDNQIRIELEKKLESLYKNDKNIYQKFIDDLQLNKTTRIKATIQQAIDENKIYFNPSKFTLEWANVEADTNSVIVQILPNEYDKKLEYVTDRLANELSDKYELIQKSLNTQVDEVIDFTNIEFMRKMAKRFGIKMGQRKFEDWQSEVIAKLKEH